MSNFDTTPKIFTTLSALDLGALLCSRVCHDVISPVGAIINGLEVLEDKDNEDMHEFAMDLIQKSAKQASARLQFARIAFGAAGSAGSEIDTGDAENVSRGMIDGEKTKIEWSIPRQYLPKNKVKLLLNLVLIAINAIPRGGLITVENDDSESKNSFQLKIVGLNAKIQNSTLDILNSNQPQHAIDAHAVQPHYTKLIAQACNMTIAVEVNSDSIVLKAQEHLDILIA